MSQEYDTLSDTSDIQEPVIECDSDRELDVAQRCTCGIDPMEGVEYTEPVHYSYKKGIIQVLGVNGFYQTHILMMN